MIEFKNITKTYAGAKDAVKNVSLRFESGEFIVFIGMSGSGKTTCMRMINRMIEPTKGTIEIDGKDTQKIDEVHLRRQIGYVIQQIGLMPHMTIYENIVMVPRLLKWSEEKCRETALRLIRRVDLPEDFLDRYPSELSGGQQQRIGVIRALAADQEIILMDEPFGALDPITRDSLQDLIKELQQELGRTVVFVTHDMDEALNLADRIVIMDAGEVVQFGTPEEILSHPVNEFVRNLIGQDRLNQAVFDYQPVSSFMMREPVSASMDLPLRDAARLMRDHRVDTLFVTDNKGVLQGTLDIFKINRRLPQDAKIEDYLSHANYIYEDTKVRDAIFAINDLGYRNMPVVNHEQQLVGLITRSSIVNLVYDGFWGDYTPETASTDLVGSTDDDTSAATPDGGEA